MIRRYLGNFKKFKCIADKCPSTCCAGWEVDIDDDTMDKYREFAESGHEYSETIKNNINWEDGCFVNNETKGSCFFLRKDRLCDIQLHLGESFLCRTCDKYPRHMEEFPGVREFTLSASCPAVAEKLLKAKRFPKWTMEEDSEQDIEEYDEFPYELYELLQECRKTVVEILQDSSISVRLRGQKVISMMKAVQDTYDEAEAEDCRAVLEHFLSGAEDETLREGLAAESEQEHFDRTRDHFDLLFEMEPLKLSFRGWLFDVRELMFENRSAAEFCEAERRFEEAFPDWELKLAQIAVYFANTYLCGSSYSGFIYAVSKEAVYNAYMIKLLWIAKWIMKDGNLRKFEMRDIVVSYCRELEHSNDNLILMDQLMDETEAVL